MMKLLQSFLLPLLVIAAIDVMPLTMGADILVSELLPLHTSHSKTMAFIAGALTRRGHNVTVLTSSHAVTKGFQRDTYTKAIQYKCYDIPAMPMNTNEMFESSVVKQLTELQSALANIRGCESFFDDSATLALLKESTFDLIIGDVFEGCEAMLSSYLGVPFVAVTTSFRYPFFHEHTFGIPSPSSYVPFALFPLSDKMSFIERIVSFLEHHVIIRFMEMTHFHALNEIKDKHGIAPGRSIQELLGGAELWMCMTNFALDYPHPTAPNWVAIGNIADSPAKPLVKDYEQFIEGAGEHGFIIFSLGSYIQELPKAEMVEAFARVFNELQQRVIWKHAGTRPPYLGNNTMMVDWLPQNDLLGHPKVRLMIYHGGLGGILEALYHAVPLVIMPLYAEQESNALKVTSKGMGRRLAKDAISYETVKAAVTDVLENPSYTENARRSSSIYRDTQSKPDETVVFWVEHILKFGGSHLRSRALELSFIQLHSIDVLAFIVGIVFVIVFLLFSCCKRCLAFCMKSKKTKVE